MKTKEMKVLKVISNNEKIVSKELKVVGKPTRNTRSKEECSELKAVAKVNDTDNSEENAESLNVNVASRDENATDPQHASGKNPTPKVSSAARRKELLEACRGKSVEALISLVSSSQVKFYVKNDVANANALCDFFFLCYLKRNLEGGP